MTTIGVVGLGAMGSRMARRLLDADYDVVVWNRSRDKVFPLADAGALTADTPADAARRSDVVITMVADPDALHAVTEGSTGILDAGDPLNLIEMSTVGPAAVSRLASALPEGAGLLDAPVLGSTSEAEAGSLVIFVGGSAPLFERWKPMLSALGRPLHLGPLGSGAAAKLVANSTLFGSLTVLGEAIALGDALGLSRSATFEVLASTPVAAQAERRRGPIETGDYPLRFSLALALKDVDLIVEAASRSGADLRLVDEARAWLADAVESGLGEEDYSALLAHILRER